jgi:hypothetical protein
MLNLTISNPAFAPLASLQCAREYQGISAKMLQPEELALLTSFIKALNPDYTPDFETLEVVTARFLEGAFNKLYGPSIVSSDTAVTKLAIAFGKDKIDITNLKASGFESAITVAKIDGYDEIVLELSLDVADENEEFIIPLRLASDFYQEAKDEKFAPKLKALFRKGSYSSIAEMLSSGAGGGGSTISKIDVLESEVAYSVLKAKEVKTKYGQSYVLTIADNDGNETNVWCPSNIKNLLSAGAVITEQTKLSYTTYVNAGGKQCIKGFLTGYSSQYAASGLADLLK